MTFSSTKQDQTKIARGAVILTLLLTALLMHAKVSAEEKTQLGNWEVHHIVLATTFLTPEIAKANSIVRSKYNSFVNISVLDSNDKKAQNVSITGTARNLLGNSKKLSFKKVSDGDAIYYLAVFSHAHKENFRFDINIQQGNETQTLELQQEMYVD
ncbi:MAG: hypothetical protein ACI9MS_003102 [Glaciecola sp.]|jgi:hypothetical protein